MEPSRENLERLLRGVEGGDREALDELFSLVYGELKELAHLQRGRWRGDHTLNTTALVHEVYVKVVGQGRMSASSRSHLRALAARAMRHVLCDHARRRASLKRGGCLDGPAPPDLVAPLDAVSLDADDRELETLASLDEALRLFERDHARASRVVECRFFGGMTVEETAVACGTSPRSVKRDWVLAQAWLRRELGDPR